MNSVARGEKTADSIRVCLNDMQRDFGPNAIPLLFTSNHDENSWSGTEFERMGDAVHQMAALTFVLPGIPLIYTGQEKGNTKRLEFFEKDTLQPHNSAEFTEFYKNLVALRKAFPALQVPPFGGTLKEVPHDGPSDILAFVRENEGNRVLALFNFSDQPVSFTLTGSQTDGTYLDWFSRTEYEISNNLTWEMEPHGYRILTLK